MFNCNKNKGPSHSKDYVSFLKKYGGLNFDNVKFRPGAPFTSGFGFDNAFYKFRFHTAVDRAARLLSPEGKAVYAPFDAEVVKVNTGGRTIWGDQLRLISTKYGFEVRIAHITILPNVLEIIEKGESIKAGTLVGHANTEGLSTGVHTHTEVVSIGERSGVLEEILQSKVEGDVLEDFFTKEESLEYMKHKGLIIDDEAFDRELKRKRITGINEYLCRKIDYITGTPVTCYDSRTLFGM